MECPLTYGQCLRQVMDSNHLSVNMLSRKMGYQGTTQLTRILRDEVSPSLVTKFHQQFMLIFEWLISPVDIRALSAALQYTCLGPDSYMTRQAMRALAFESSLSDPQDIPVVVSPAPPSGRPVSLRDVLERAHACRRIDLLILGSAFDSLLPHFAALANRPDTALRIRHVFILEDKPAQLVSQIAAQLPFLNVNAYEGSYLPESKPEACRYLRAHQVALLRAEREDGSVYTDLITPPHNGKLHVCRLQGDNALFPFYEDSLNALRDLLRPPTVIYPQPRAESRLHLPAAGSVLPCAARGACAARARRRAHAGPLARRAAHAGAHPRARRALPEPAAQEGADALHPLAPGDAQLHADGLPERSPLRHARLHAR